MLHSRGDECIFMKLKLRKRSGLEALVSIYSLVHKILLKISYVPVLGNRKGELVTYYWS
jgi:hypothetical protein